MVLERERCSATDERTRAEVDIRPNGAVVAVTAGGQIESIATLSSANGDRRQGRHRIAQLHTFASRCMVQRAREIGSEVQRILLVLETRSLFERTGRELRRQSDVNTRSHG